MSGFRFMWKCSWCVSWQSGRLHQLRGSSTLKQNERVIYCDTCGRGTTIDLDKVGIRHENGTIEGEARTERTEGAEDAHNGDNTSVGGVQTVLDVPIR